MTPIPRAREEITLAALGALSANSAQAQRIYDPSHEIDSALEHVLAAARRVTDPHARRHLAAAVEDLKHAHKLNLVERDHEETIRDQASEAGRNRWTVQSLANALRAPLGVLGNPMIQGARREDALAEARGIIASAPRDLLVTGDNVKPALAHELRVAKSTTLWTLLAEPQAVVA